MKERPDIDLIWKEYKSTKKLDLREKLIEQYLDLVKYIAGRVAVNLPRHVDKNDLMIVGVIGLIDAIEKYDIDSGVKFQTYASLRVRGSIIDELRSQDWMPRSARKKISELEVVLRKLEEKLGRYPYEEEIAEEMGVSIEKLNEILSDSAVTSLLSLNIKDERSAKSTDILDSIEDKKNPLPFQQLEYEDIKKTLANLISALSEQERKILALYYFEGLTLKEIGEILNISESRVSQVHTKAILQLRVKMKKMKESFI